MKECKRTDLVGGEERVRGKEGWGERECVCLCVCIFWEELRFRALNLKQIYRGGGREGINMCETHPHRLGGGV